MFTLFGPSQSEVERQARNEVILKALAICMKHKIESAGPEGQKVAQSIMEEIENLYDFNR